MLADNQTASATSSTTSSASSSTTSAATTTTPVSTNASSTPSSSSTSAPVAKSVLSTGAKAGIGASIGAVAIVGLVIAFLLFYQRMKRKRADSAELSTELIHRNELQDPQSPGTARDVAGYYPSDKKDDPYTPHELQDSIQRHEVDGSSHPSELP